MIIISTSVGIDNVIIIWFQPNDWLIDFLLTNFYHCVLISFINKYISWLIDLHCALIYSFLSWEIICVYYIFLLLFLSGKKCILYSTNFLIFTVQVFHLFIYLFLFLYCQFIFLSIYLIFYTSICKVKTYQSIYYLNINPPSTYNNKVIIFLSYFFFWHVLKS